MRGQGVRRLARLIVILLGAVVPASAEQVYTDFDLAGWGRLGLLRVETSLLDIGSPADLMDRSNVTSVRTQSPSATFILTFKPTQVVRKVSLQPGSHDPYLVTLTVIAEDGRRFAAGEVEVENGRLARFQLRNVPTNKLEFAVERREGDGPVHVAELKVLGEVNVDRILLENVPATLPEGGSFPVVVSGRDAFGGKPDLTALAELVVSPNRAVLVEGNRVVTRAAGPITISAHVGSLESARQPVLVEKLQPAPVAPILRPGHEQIRIQLSGQPPFEIFRRSPGEKAGQPIGRVDGRLFIDGVPPGSAHQYSVRQVDVYGNPLTDLSEETRARAHSTRPEGSQNLGRLPVLVVIYTDSLPGGAKEADHIEASLEAARLFVFRHTAARLLLDLTTIRRSGPTPSTSGPTMAFIERDLRRQGIPNNAYGLVFAIAGDLDGSFGNFVLLGDTAGAFGRSPGVATPTTALGPDAAAAWDFVHELQHVLNESVAASVGIGGLPTGHFAQDYASGRLGGAGLDLDVGEAWDGQAALLRLTEFWGEVGLPYRRPLEVVDKDGDGLPDEDPALPMDESRFGSSPDAVDTDGDGLGDLAEFMAGLYTGTDPSNPDTDGDGSSDGNDVWPLSNFTGEIPYGTEPQFVASGPDPHSPKIELLACWNEKELVLAVETDSRFDLFVDLDGSGTLGRWASDVRTGTAGAAGSDVYAGPARVSVRAFETPRGVFIGERPIPGARIGTREKDGQQRVTVHLPGSLGVGSPDVHIVNGAKPAEGLRLTPGSILGLGITVRESTGNQPLAAFARDTGWLSLFETHRLMDATLTEIEPDAEAMNKPAQPPTSLGTDR
jgi:hypothetical protein